jgi:hypothetical protein
MKLTNESATAMLLPIPISTVVSLQQRRCEFVQGSPSRDCCFWRGSAALGFWPELALRFCPPFFNTICRLWAFRFVYVIFLSFILQVSYTRRL